MIEGHGGNVVELAKELGCRPEDIVDMSSNINPLGALPGLIEHLRGQMGRITSLPEVDAQGAVRAVAALLGVDGQRVLAGNGTTQFIHTACVVLQSRRVLIVGPTYADYTDSARLHGITPEFFLTSPGCDFAVDVEELGARLAGVDTVFLCNPNNPTGRLISHGELLDLCTRHPGVRFIIDESYLPFAGDDQSMCQCGLENVIVLWSASKIFGIPGLRVGFLVAGPSVIKRFRGHMQPWCVNSLAQEAVRYIGDHPETVAAFIARTREHLDVESTLFRERLAGAPLVVYPSTTSYLLIRLPEGHTADSVCRALSEKRFLIRNCANFHGLDESYIRIALKDTTANTAVAGHLLAHVHSQP
ncbi:MAG: pyridoxal phosphate-dependent class II aminotransferase [Desulfobulbus sp.]|nr:pyridoxal phosphate-dependent class II aminotransferase [Desulfobulbus sp.]